MRTTTDAANAANAIRDLEPLVCKLIPVKHRDKAPRDKGWKSNDYSDVDWTEHLADGGNVGVVPGPHVLVIDVDTRNGGEESLERLDPYGIIPGNAKVMTGGGGFHLYLGLPSGHLRLRTKHPDFPGIDFKTGKGGFVVAPGSIHPNGKAYRRVKPWPTAFPEAPADLLALLARPEPDKAASKASTGAAQGTPEMLATMLAVLKPEDFGAGGEYHDEWLPLAMACHAYTNGEGREAWLDWCAGDDAYGNEAREQNGYRWDSFTAGAGIRPATLFAALTRAGHPELVAQADRVNAADDFEEEPGEDATAMPGKRVAGLTTVRASEVEQEPIQWLWDRRIALGKITGIAGVPDQGKSQVTIAIAATVSNGDTFPDGARAPLGDVILMSAEDDPADTTVPRLAAAGADLSKVHILNMLVRGEDGKRRMFSLKDHLSNLRKLVAQHPEVKLIVIDPISAYMGVGEVDTFKGSDVRGTLAPLGELAAKAGIAVVFVAHFNKSGTGSAINRVSDSHAFTALARSFWAVLPEKDEDDATTGRKLMVRIKQNIAAPMGGLAYRLEQVDLPRGIVTSKVVWDGPVDMTADEVLNGRPAEQQSPKLTAAKKFLVATLANGRLRATLVNELALAEGISPATLRRARKEVGITTEEDADGWWWTLDDED